MIGRHLAIILALSAIAPRSSAWSQQIINLEGRVRDEFRGIARAQVNAVDSLTNERRSATTDERGFFRMLDLSPGRYAVTARLIGYASMTQTVQLVVGERAAVEFVLQPTAAILETVEVHGQEAQGSEIQRMSVSTAVTEQEIHNLPLNTRNVMELAAVAPGIRSFRPVEGRSLPASGPLRDQRAINLYLDGVEMKNLNTGNVVGSPQTGSPLPADALQEFRVLLNTYDAEFTRGSAYIISAVTHRGTNERHGSVFGFFQNKNLVAVTDFQRQIPNFEKPDFKRLQAGFSLRGPFVRDRLFYALNYELSDTRDFIAVVPGRPASDPGIWDSYAGVFNAPNRNHTGLLRLTWAANDDHLFEAIWSSRNMTGESAFGGTDAHESAVAQHYIVNTVKLRQRWLPTSQFANELSLQFVGWLHEDRALVAGPEFVYPTLRIGRANATFEIHETQFRAVERATYSIGGGPGSHLLKGGLEISRVTAAAFQPSNGRGLFTFRSETAGPSSAVIAVGFVHPESDRDAVTGLTGLVAGGYVNDEWQLTSRLLLNLGVRYDAEINILNNDFTVPWASDTALSSRPELEGLLNRGNRKNDLDNISPRVSFSWDVSGNRRTFLRGGFGIMYDRVPGFTAFNERRTSTWRTYMFTNPGTTDPDELRNRILAGGGTAVPPSIVLLPNRMESPENRQWSVGFGTQLARSLALNVDYIDQDVRRVFAPVNLNWLDRSQTPPRRVLSAAYGNIMAWGDFARARYRALLTSLSYSPDTGLRLNLAHTLGSAKADWDIESINVPAAVADQFYVQQRISGDERHRFVLSGMWSLRYGLGVSMIATAASPRPYKTWVGEDLNKNGLQEDDWIDGRRYAVPSNAWRNWYRVVDVRLTKAFAIGGGARLSVIAEAFNLFNTENYAGYFGVQRSDTGEPRPDFGSPSGIFATRQFQLGTRLEF